MQPPALVSATTNVPTGNSPPITVSRNLAWQRNVKVLVGVSCIVIIVAGGLYFSGQLQPEANYAMMGLMGAGGVALTASFFAMRKWNKIPKT